MIQSGNVTKEDQAAAKRVFPELITNLDNPEMDDAVDKMIESLADGAKQCLLGLLVNRLAFARSTT